MSETEIPYLICHKVRGQPAFDVAIKLEGDIWIIPTSGHRAYPFVSIELRTLGIEYEANTVLVGGFRYVLPPTLPDHYSMNDTKPKRMSELTLEDLEI